MPSLYGRSRQQRGVTGRATRLPFELGKVGYRPLRYPESKIPTPTPLPTPTPSPPPAPIPAPILRFPSPGSGTEIEDYSKFIPKPYAGGVETFESLPPGYIPSGKRIGYRGILDDIKNAIAFGGPTGGILPLGTMTSSLFKEGTKQLSDIYDYDPEQQKKHDEAVEYLKEKHPEYKTAGELQRDRLEEFRGSGGQFRDSESDLSDMDISDAWEAEQDYYEDLGI
jgi:hypothetical protein